jgi:DNA gyrase/topoisomerase IV subunit A
MLSQQETLQTENSQSKQEIRKLQDTLQSEQSRMQVYEQENKQMKRLIAQASETLTRTEEEYFSLSRQVEILTKKMQLVMTENERLRNVVEVSKMKTHQQQQPSLTSMSSSRSLSHQQRQVASDTEVS